MNIPAVNRCQPITNVSIQSLPHSANGISSQFVHNTAYRMFLRRTITDRADYKVHTESSLLNCDLWTWRSWFLKRWSSHADLCRWWTVFVIRKNYRPIYSGFQVPLATSSNANQNCIWRMISTCNSIKNANYIFLQPILGMINFPGFTHLFHPVAYCLYAN
jgi:hypothetical protein